MELAYDLLLPPGDAEVNLPPVILLHGMLDSRKTWKFVAPELAKQTGRKVYAVDARNHGESQWRDDMSFDILANDLDNFMSQHGIAKAVLVGHSMGGRTALTEALLKPEKVEKLVVEDITLQNFRPQQSNIIVNITKILEDSLEAVPPEADDYTAREAIVAYFKSFLPKNNSPQLSYDLSMMPLKQENGKYCWQANFNAIRNMLTTDSLRQTLSGVYMGDTIFLYGTKSVFKVDRDPLIPKFFPRAVRVGIEKATHLIHFEFPSRFISEVANFINDNRLRSMY